MSNAFLVLGEVIQCGSSIRSVVDLNDNDKKNAYVIIRAFIIPMGRVGWSS